MKNNQMEILKQKNAKIKIKNSVDELTNKIERREKGI